MNKVPLSGYCQSSTILMSDCEENLDDFPTENLNNPVESMVGAFREESTESMGSCEWNHYKNTTTL